MNIQEILMRFALIADLNLEEAAPWLPICSEAAEEIRGQLKNAADEATHARRLTAAAAALAFYRYTLYRASGSGMDTFSAGDVKITSDKKNSVQIAQSVWCNARNTVSDVLKDDGFLFEQVKFV